jgi:hypothetical protein
MNKITAHTPYKREDFRPHEIPSVEAWEWYTNKDGDVHIFEEWCLKDHVNYNGKIKIATLEEVPTIYEHAKQFDPNNTWTNPYEWIKDNHQHFNYIMSCYTFLKDIVGEKYIWAPLQHSLILREQIGLYEKEKLLSIIASAKTMTPGHRMRHEVINKYGKHMDIYGSGYNTILNSYATTGKIIALAPYYFTIIIPNTNIDDFYSDQLTDAMLVGTVPIFCGTKNVGKHFNIDGIIQFNSVEELENIIPTLNKQLYESKMDAIVENFEKAKHHDSAADWLYHNKKDFLENLSI